MFVGDYTSRIKEIRDSLTSINMTVDEDEMVQVYLGGLASKFGAFRTTVCTRVICHLSSSCSRCCSLKKTTWVRQQAHTPTTRCCTWRGTGLVVVVDKGYRHTMEAANKNRTKGIEMVSTTVPDPPRVGRVKAVLVPSKGRLRRISGNVAERVAKRVCWRK